MSDPLAELRAAVVTSSDSLHEGGTGSPPSLENPPDPDLGDYSTNAAMLLAPALGETPRDIADRLSEHLRAALGEALERAEVAGPGFLNLFLSDSWYRDAVAALAAAGDGVGRPPSTDPNGSVLVEFVSANPTGPLTAAGGRHAAYGDSVARILEICGHRVQREYYLNDAGGQIERFAASIAARMKGEEPPEDGYRGDYVAEIAARLRENGVDPGDRDAIARLGTELMRDAAEASLRRLSVEFDNWFSERSLHGDGAATERALADLRASEHVYESEGAVWLRTSAFGDDKDRVLVRSEGEPTYLLADIAYHRDKLERADALIDVLGADHHGYIARLRAGIEALGSDSARLEFAIMQLVNVVEGGERSQMSKRKGEFVTLDELIDDIGADATRFFMVQRSNDTAIDLDLELARSRSNENPVYYVQYAHARIAGILRRASAPDHGGEPRVPLEPAERALIRRLCELPGEVAEAASRRAPHRLCGYATALAADFHAFYRDCQVVGAEGEGVEPFRLELCVVAGRTIARTLGLLGIRAPERM